MVEKQKEERRKVIVVVRIDITKVSALKPMLF